MAVPVDEYSPRARAQREIGFFGAGPFVEEPTSGGDGARPPDSTQKIVLNKDSAAGGKKKGGCC